MNAMPDYPELFASPHPPTPPEPDVSVQTGGPIPHSQVVLTLALFGTIALATVNPFVTYWDYISLAAMYLITLLVYASQRRITGVLVRDVGPITSLWTVVFLASIFLEHRFGELITSGFIIVVTFVVSAYWFTKPHG